SGFWPSGRERRRATAQRPAAVGPVAKSTTRSAQPIRRGKSAQPNPPGQIRPAKSARPNPVDPRGTPLSHSRPEQCREQRGTQPAARRPRGAERQGRQEERGRARGMYDRDLERNPANYSALTPLDFLVRAASVFPRKIAVIDGARRFTYAQLHARCRRLASA